VATRRRALACAALLAALLAGCREPSGDSHTAERCVVASLSDGDSLHCADGRRVRLLSIDAPEMAQAPYGEEARRRLDALLPAGTAARLELDVEPSDRFGRTLAYVYTPAGELVNLEMARSGHAVELVYPPNLRHADAIRAAVEEARDEGRGLWASGGFACRPVDFRAGRCR
jgi:micrococcal nuclease